ncbi:MAG TPA: preprotein translocase subunit SecG [Xanthomonadaceae bacterium]|jgi:preprotein translocase subunit SecG|nr:preprotein translocase subunit SecG [Xanthomonadaceae bacterium]
MNLIVIATVIYVLVAVAMIVLILMQRGAGAQAGSGFGAGASATVFGASGSANFLSKSTKWLAIVFFGMSLGMAWYASQHGGRLMPAESDDVGLMGAAAEQVPAPAADAAPAAPAAEPAPVAVPAAAEPAVPATENPPQGESGG